MRWIPATLTVLLAFPVAADVEPWTLDRLDLELRITLDPPAVELSGTARVRALAASDGPAFGLNDDVKVMALQSLRADGIDAVIRPFAPGSPIDVAEITLAQVVEAGTIIEVEFRATSSARSSQFII